MSCCRYHALEQPGCDTAFTLDPPTLTFGRGCLSEAGPRARFHGMTRVALFTDAGLADTVHVAAVLRSLQAAGLDTALYADCHVEPTDQSFLAAARFARQGRFDGYVSVGGGSVIDTAKAANLLATHGGELADWVNAPLGAGRAVPGPLAPHLACPTTAGTGSEGTGIAIFDWLEHHVKTGIAHRFLRPTEGLVDPDCAATLPPMVTACGGFDILCHALESFTARPYTARPRPDDPVARPASQGANPWSDIGCREALRLLGRFLVRGVTDPSDVEARTELAWASSLAGIAFGNSGVHAPHGMAYAVAGNVRDFRLPDYPSVEPMVPHGLSVVVTAPAVFRETAPGDPARHLEAAGLLGADLTGLTEADAGPVLAERLLELMRATGLPTGLTALGYTAADVPTLVDGAHAQQRLLVNAPVPMTRERLAALFQASI